MIYTPQKTIVLIFGLVLIFFWFWPGKHPEPRQVELPFTQTQSSLSIAKLSLKVPIVSVANNDDISVQTALGRGVAHLAQTAQPGEVGNCYIVGHSSDYPWVTSEYKAVFAQLPSLQAGDQIQIITDRGTWDYTIIETRIINADDLSVLTQDTAGRRLLTLQTSYPIGSAARRFIVVAELMQK